MDRTNTFESVSSTSLQGYHTKKEKDAKLFALEKNKFRRVVSTSIRGFRKDFVEPKKVAIQYSQWAAGLKSLIHLIPLGVAILEIVRNWQGRYIGATFDLQSYYQFAAKAHEILIQASLGTVLLSFILRGLAGKGLPFGALLSGLQFTQVSYMWSTELWSSVFAQGFYLSKKLAFLAIALTCGLIAATSGPSSATLLIPRLGFWPLLFIHVVVNSTSQDIWPNSVTIEGIPPGCTYVSETPLDLACPAADSAEIVQVLLDLFAAGPYLNPINPQSNSTLVSGEALGFQSVGEIANRYCVFTTCPHESDQVCASCPQEIVERATFDADTVWIGDFAGFSNVTYLDILFDVDANYVQPYTIANCLADTIENADDPGLLELPGLVSNDCTTDNSIARPSELLGFRLSWVSLPLSIFNESAIGAVLFHPRDSDGQSAQNITVCTIGAGWGSSALHSDIRLESSFFSTIAGVPEFFQTVQYSVFGVELGVPAFTIGQEYAYPQQRISISQEWAELLNPLFLLPGGSNTSAINEYMLAASAPTSNLFVAKILSMMLTTGLSRIGADLVIEVLTSSSIPCQDCLTFDIQPSLQGWAYTSDGVLTKLSICVMFCYYLLAFGHTIYLLTTGLTSGAWNTAAEVVALTMNSTPTKFL
ncbi:MAG: hypothetical protein MMC33_007078 [Icmadophila ericetorum]|nr:hypothetical protein [Icmadophila ericetorum]